MSLNTLLERRALTLAPLDVTELTWLGLATAVHDCALHYSQCPCLKICLEALHRSDESVADDDVDAMLGEIVTLLSDSQEGQRQGLLEIAECVDRLLLPRFAKRSPFLKARTQVNLAILFNRWGMGAVEDKLLEGERFALTAIQFLTRDEHPKEWASAAGALANNYSSRLSGDNACNRQQAIYWFERALAVNTKDRDPAGYTALRGNLAVAHLDEGSHASIARALPLLEDSREFHKNAGMSKEWMNDTCDLACGLILADGPAQLARAEELMREGLAAVDPDAQPTRWAWVVTRCWRAW